MRFSLYSLMRWPEGDSQRGLFHDALEQLSLAEAQGYYCAWLADPRTSRSGIGPATHLAAANLAARTNTIRIGTSVTILPFMHPLNIAEEIAMLDILSEGRIEWGVGRGYQGRDFDGHGVDVASSHEVFDEQLEIIKKAWTGAPFAHAGDAYKFDELQCFPSPIQKPGPPIHIAATDADTIEWAARNQYRVLGDSFSPAAVLGKYRDLYGEAASSIEWESSAPEISSLRLVYVGESTKRAREEAAPALLAHFRSNPEFAGEDFEDPEAFLTYLFDECAIVGDEAYCRDRITELRETIGLDQLICWQNFGSLSHEQALASQERFAIKVAPVFA